MSLDALPAIQREAGLDHYARGAFVETLRYHCGLVAVDHPQLARWIGTRQSLLDFRLTTAAEMPRELGGLSAVFEVELVRASQFLWQGEHGVRLASKLADKLQTEALLAAGVALCSVMNIGEQDQPPAVNLMIPIKAVGSEPGFSPNDCAKANVEHARRVWGGIPQKEIEHYLVIVAETRDDEHLGFWVPTLKDHSRPPLPGAPVAFQHGHGTSVFKSDLPAMEQLGFPRVLEKEWETYMEREFREKLFVSIPLVLPGRGAGSTVAGVVNINATPHDESRSWLRACHREWLQVAIDRVAPFARMAYYCHLLKAKALGPGWSPKVEIASKLFDGLPVAEDATTVLGGPAKGALGKLETGDTK